MTNIPNENSANIALSIIKLTRLLSELLENKTMSSPRHAELLEKQSDALNLLADLLEEEADLIEKIV